MISPVIIHVFFNILSCSTVLQDSSCIHIQQGILQIDSISTVIDKNDSLETRMVVGAYPMIHQFKGTVYQDRQSGKIQKLILLSTSNGKTIRVYTEGRKIFKIIYEKVEYFKINTEYYTRSHSREFSADLLEMFSEIDAIITTINKIFKPAP